MSHQDHLTIRDLLRGASSAERLQRAGHEPEACPVCGNTNRLFQTLKTALREASFQGGEAPENCPEETDLIDAFEGRGETGQRGEVLEHAEKCSACFERLAFYFKAADAMRGFAGALVKDPLWSREGKLKERCVPSLRERAAAFLQEAACFLWSPAAGYGLATVLLAVLLAGGPSRERLVSLGSPAPLTVVKAVDGYGFQGSDEETTTVRPFEGMTAKSIAGGRILFSWPAIEGAGETRFILFRVREGRPVMVLDRKTTRNRIEVDCGSFPENSLYRWTLTGSLTGERKFYTSAEFIFLGS